MTSASAGTSLGDAGRVSKRLDTRAAAVAGPQQQRLRTVHGRLESMSEMLTRRGVSQAVRTAVPLYRNGFRKYSTQNSNSSSLITGSDTRFEFMHMYHLG